MFNDKYFKLNDICNIKSYKITIELCDDGN